LVVNDQVAPVVEPTLFFATTYHEYVVLALSVVATDALVRLAA
jgi:hypothetical protein